MDVYFVETFFPNDPGAGHRDYFLAETANVAISDALLSHGPVQLGDPVGARAVKVNENVSPSAFKLMKMGWKKTGMARGLYSLKLWPRFFPHNEHNPIVDPLAGQEDLSDPEPE